MKITVIGLGYVGSVAAAGLAKAGHLVTGIDIDRERVDAYRRGEVPIFEPGLGDLVREMKAAGRLSILHRDDTPEPIGEVALIAAGTGAKSDGAADLSHVSAAISWVVERRAEDCVIVMKSTVPPGTGGRLSETMLRGTGFSYVANPEFLREGQALGDWFQPDRIVIGSEEDAPTRVVQDLTSGIDAPYVVTDITSAEMIKYASNAFLATKISFANEIAILCERLGATIDDVVDGMSLDPRIGAGFLGAGVGYGGSCLPKDVKALTWLAMTEGHRLELLEAVETVNSRQRLAPLYALRERLGPLSGKTIGVLGLAFKPHTDDVREAPSVDLVHALVEEGAQVKAYDPKAMAAAESAVPSEVMLTRDPYECADDAHSLVLMTEWPEIVEAAWEELAERAKPPRFLFDGRNALDPARMRDLGFEYRGIGRGPNAHFVEAAARVGHHAGR